MGDFNCQLEKTALLNQGMIFISCKDAKNRRKEWLFHILIQQRRENKLLSKKSPT